MAAETRKIMNKTCVSTVLLAEFFGVSRQAVNQWGKQGCPKAARVYWCVADVIAWRESQTGLTDGKKLDDLSLKEQKMYWETRCREEQAENQKFKNAVLRGDYLEKTEMEKELAAFFITFKQAALSLPRKCAVVASAYVGNGRARKMEREMMEVVTDALGQWSQGDCTVDS